MSSKKKFGDRRDGKLIRDLDPLHYFSGLLYPNRCDNEAFISERIDLTAINEYIAEKNAQNPDFQYKLFQFIVTAIAKTITLRPKMNRFIVNGNFYQRNEVTTSFVVKKEFSDNGGEALAFLHMKDDDNLETIRESMKKIVRSSRSEKADESTESMNMISSLPRFVSKFVAHASMWLDKHGHVPKSFIASDPFYSSCVLSNVGSIKLKSGYHHLTNWGTCSLFCMVGEIKKRPVFNDDGSYDMKETVDLGLTVDERLADGYYYSKSVRLVKTLLENPELLETKLSEEVDF